MIPSPIHVYYGTVLAVIRYIKSGSLFVVQKKKAVENEFETI